MATLWRISALGVVLAMGLACHRETDRLAEIRALQGDGHYADSIAPLRRLLDSDPAQVEANLLLGKALLQTGQPGLAIWPLGKAGEAPEYAVEAGMLLARAMLDSRSGPEAVTAIERVLELKPDDTDALAIRAEAYMVTGRTVDALADLDRVRELDPENLGVLVPRVTALIGLGEIEEAEEALQDARERFESAGPEVSPSLQARLCIATGLFAFERGETEAAEAQYAECLEQFPSDPLAVTETAAHYQRTGRAEEATEILRRAYEQTGSTYFRMGLAGRMGALGDAAEQERLLREEAEERPSWLAWFRLADLYVRREDYDQAIDAFERGLDASSAPSPKLLFAYADTLVQAGRYGRAREIAQQIAAPELRHLIRGRLLLAEGDAEGSLRAFEAGIRLWPNNPGGRFLAGQAAERVGDFERAGSHYRESLRAGADQSEAGLALARLYETRGDLDGALDAIGRYLRSHPGDPEGYRVTIRLAHALDRHDLRTTGLERLARLPGQKPVAVAEEARLEAEQSGPQRGIDTIDAAELDLTDPQNVVALDELLALLVDAEQIERAQSLSRRAVEAQPTEAAFHALRGRVLRAAGQTAQAHQSFEQALELDPKDPQALVGSAELAAEAGDREAAVELYDRAAAADPDDPAAARAAARLLLDAEKNEEAEARLTRLLQAHPRDGATALLLAELAAERGERDRALALAERATWLHTPGADEVLERVQGGGSAAAPVAEVKP